MSQVLDALALATQIKSARARIIQPLRRGDLVISDVDLDAPELRTMRVIDFLAALRYRSGTTRTHFKPPATSRPAKILAQLGCGGKRMGDLTDRQKHELVRLVEAVPVQRRSR